MKKKLAFLAAAFFCGALFTSFSPSLDGKAVVADEGALPKGIFAKTVGYLPGDTISVTNLFNKSTVEILVIGAIDPSEGVAILLSPEAAKLLGLEKGSNSVVKITKRSGQLDEAVAGTAVIGGEGAAEAEQDEAAEENAEAEAEEAEKEAEQAVAKAETAEKEIAEPLPTETAESPAAAEPEQKPLERAESEPVEAEALPEPVERKVDESAPQKTDLRAEPEKVYADSLAEDGASAQSQEKSADSGAAPYEVIADERLPDTGGAYPEPAVEKISSPYSNLERVDERLPPDHLPDDEKRAPSKRNERKPYAGAAREKPPVESEKTPVQSIADNKFDDENAEKVREDKLSELKDQEPEGRAVAEDADKNTEAVEDDSLAAPLEEEFAESGSPERFEPESPPDEIAPEPFKEDGELSEFETSAEEPASPEPEKTDDKKPATAKKSSGAGDEVTLVPTGMNPPPKRSGTETKANAKTPRPAEKTPAPEAESVDDPAITGLDAADEMKSETITPQDSGSKPEPVTVSGGSELEKNTVPSLKELESGKYYVQIGVFKDDGNIKPIFDKYRKEYPITIVPLASGTAKQVLIGPLGVDEYGTVLNRFKSYGFKDAFLRKIR
ncbi:MAG: hypothetical protein ACTTKL_06685 [Treponema sp.]